jgi:hypothetical protein
MSDEEIKPDDQKPRCSSCKHYLIQDYKNIAQGKCTRFPPVYFSLPQEQQTAPNQILSAGPKKPPFVVYVPVCDFPDTKGSSKCGEYDAKTTMH